MSRQEFSAKTREQAFEHCKDANGIPRCEGCGADLRNKRKRFDHIKRDIDGGVNSVLNCQVLCEEICDKKKTGREQREHLKAVRARRAHNGTQLPAAKKIQSPGFPTRDKPRMEKPCPAPAPGYLFEAAGMTRYEKFSVIVAIAVASVWWWKLPKVQGEPKSPWVLSTDDAFAAREPAPPPEVNACAAYWPGLVDGAGPHVCYMAPNPVASFCNNEMSACVAYSFALFSETIGRNVYVTDASIADAVSGIPLALDINPAGPKPLTGFSTINRDMSPMRKLLIVRWTLWDEDLTK